MSEEVTKKILKEMEQMSKGGEGSGQKGHKTENKEPDIFRQGGVGNKKLREQAYGLKETTY